MSYIVFIPNGKLEAEAKTMFVVKKLHKETVIKQVELVGGVASLRTRRRETWAVMDEGGEVVRGAGGQYEIFTQKTAAQAQADWYNRQSVVAL